MTDLYGLLAQIRKVDDVLFVIKSGGATAEIRSNLLAIRQSGKWITLGSNDGPAHMHVNAEQTAYAEFVQEQKPERTSFSVRFYGDGGERVLAAFFTKMYDESGSIIPWRKRAYTEILQKYNGKRVTFVKNALPKNDRAD